MLPLLLVSALIGIVGSSLTGQFEFWLPIVGVLTLWILLRILTPPEGIAAAPIRSTPGVFILFSFALASLAAMGIVVAIDVIVFSHPFSAPLKPYHLVLFAPPFLIMFTGAWLSDRAAKKHRQLQKPPAG